MKHTKGPWTACTGIGCFPHVHIGEKMIDKNGRFFKKGSCMYYLVINEISHGGNMEEHEANAHLIASAPDLLEACKRAFTYLDKPYTSGLGNTEIINQLEEAISKAEEKG